MGWGCVGIWGGVLGGEGVMVRLMLVYGSRIGVWIVVTYCAAAGRRRGRAGSGRRRRRRRAGGRQVYGAQGGGAAPRGSRRPLHGRRRARVGRGASRVPRLDDHTQSPRPARADRSRRRRYARAQSRGADSPTSLPARSVGRVVIDVFARASSLRSPRRCDRLCSRGCRRFAGVVLLTAVSLPLPPLHATDFP